MERIHSILDLMTKTAWTIISLVILSWAMFGFGWVVGWNTGYNKALESEIRDLEREKRHLDEALSKNRAVGRPVLTPTARQTVSKEVPSKQTFLAGERDDICERTPAVQRALKEQLNTSVPCSLISSRDLLPIRTLTISTERIQAGDLAGLENLETLRLYLGQKPPAITGKPQLKNFLLEWGQTQYSQQAYCGGKFSVNGVPREIGTSAGGCRVSFGDH